ncbi:MAG: hypothetical protein BVN34_02720 [Proteobacteria bacterium ST_bin12]|nr:MAG: hypothetical protein BVN34_02720 [Proteobacteria bacterium ST_bin12]
MPNLDPSQFNIAFKPGLSNDVFIQAEIVILQKWLEEALVEIDQSKIQGLTYTAKNNNLKKEKE